MKQRIATLVAAITVMAITLPATVLASPIGQARRGANSSGGRGSPSVPNVIETVTNILIFIVGAASVVMIVIGAIRYVTSGGDESQTKAAKNTILYSIVGLILAISAYGIVQFVLNQF